MEDEDRVRGSGCCCCGADCWRGSARILWIVVSSSLAPSLTLIGVGEVGVSGRLSRGDSSSGEKEGNEVKDLSEAAMDEAELEGCDVNLALLLLARTIVDLCELLDRADC